MRRILKRKYALVGLVATISVLTSLVCVSAYTTYGSLLRAKKGGCPLFWLYVFHPQPDDTDPYTSDDIVEIRFYFGLADDSELLVPTTITEERTYEVEFEIPGSYMRYGAHAEYTYIEVEFDDGEVYWAVGPAPMWRRAG